MMPKISVNTLLPVAIATGHGDVSGQAVFLAPLGAIPNQPGSALTLILYALLGSVISAAAAPLIRALRWA